MRGFHEALSRAGSPLIAEIKPSSPKVGPLLAQRSVREIAQDYMHAGAPCLSVTTGAWHKGNLGMVTEMAKTGLPVLRKDFITSQRHLEQSRDAGAAAVLLTCALLRQADVVRLAEAALKIGLTPFVEAASDKELDGLRLPAGAILAINNRDIRSKETDDGGIATSEALYGFARAQHIGPLVSASGLLTPDNARRAMEAGFDGVLVGTALLAGPASAFETTQSWLRACAARLGAVA